MTDGETFDEHAAWAGVASEKPPSAFTVAVAEVAARDWVLHVDLDEFLAAVEVARRPELRGKPVVVGGQGDPTQRAVVATASSEARAFGIDSGMPLRTAARRCPDPVFLPSDPPVYEAVSEQVMAALRELPVVVVLGWDEALLGARTDDPEALAASAQRAVKARVSWCARWGSATTACRPSSPPPSPSRPGSTGSPGITGWP